MKRAVRKRTRGRPGSGSDEGGSLRAVSGGYIVGRHIELVPPRVDCPGVAGWKLEPRAWYSLVRFELLDLSPGHQDRL